MHVWLWLRVEDEAFLKQLELDEQGATEISPGVLGVYGIPLDDGEFHANIDGGWKEGMDEPTGIDS